MCISNSTQDLVGIYNLRQSTAPKSRSKYTTFEEFEVNSEKLIKHSTSELWNVQLTQIFSAVIFTETLSWGFWQFFPTGTYAGIGTKCVEFENVMKSGTKKIKQNVTCKIILDQNDPCN